MFAKSLINIVETNFVYLVNCYSDIDNLFRSSNHFGNATQYFAIVQFYNNVNAKAFEHFIYHRHQLYLTVDGRHAKPVVFGSA